MKTLAIPDHPNPKPHEVSLEEIFSQVDGCRRCPLCENTTTPELGIGNERARVLVLIDAVDSNLLYKDRMSSLEKLLSPAGLSLSDVYITSLIKCPIPPGRQATSFEIQECAPILREEIRSIWPEVIISMGTQATQFIMHSEVGVSPLQGRMYRRGQFQILPTFHIEQIMRDPVSMKTAQQTMSKLGDWLKNNSRS